MKIRIEYEASWRNSFLDGCNNKLLPRKGRKFIGSMTSLKDSGNYICREITLDTVMGILNRLIGDQRKLYQAREDINYFFKDVEPLISFQDKPKQVNMEMTYIRNITGSTAQSSFSGIIINNSPMLVSDFSKQLWGILALDLEELYDFIANFDYEVDKDISLDPTCICDLSETVSKIRAVENTGDTKSAVEILTKAFSDIVTDKMPLPYIEKNGSILPVRLYSGAIYIQLERLKKKFDMTLALTKSGKIPGFSKRGFNGKRDFMKNFVTGGEKKIWGNPYMREDFVKGEGKSKRLLKKVNGQLQININVDRNLAKEIHMMIEKAGVSSFYLGKKGLAYVTDIRV